MEWDRAVTSALELMSIFQRERLRERLMQLVAGDGRDRVTLADLERARAARRMSRPQEDPLPERAWPVLSGAYRLFDPAAPVAVCTLASEALAHELEPIGGLNIAGRAFTENLGAEKVAINVVANPAIRVLLLCGPESRHRVGQTLRALHAYGVGVDGRVTGAEGPLPLMANFPPEAQELFREQVRIVDLVGERDVPTIRRAIARAAASAGDPRSRAWRPAVLHDAAPAGSPRARPEDPAGFLLLAIGPHRDRIVVEHYSPGAVLLGRFQGRSAEEVCAAVMAAGAVTDLGHAGYLGREAAKAEIALRGGLAYEQDRPLTLAPGGASDRPSASGPEPPAE